MKRPGAGWVSGDGYIDEGESIIGITDVFHVIRVASDVDYGIFFVGATEIKPWVATVLIGGGVTR